ncbi:MAG: hypothetical protein ACLR5J_01715 [Lachnospiraceae bacterium]
MTEEGYLIVVDEIMPGADAEGMAGGPVWQLMNPPVWEFSGQMPWWKRRKRKA